MKLRVSDNQRFLVREDGKPFFYLADTAWELFHRLTFGEAELYLRDRARLVTHNHFYDRCLLIKESFPWHAQHLV